MPQAVRRAPAATTPMPPIDAGLPPGSLIAPDRDTDTWRFVSPGGRVMKFSPEQVALCDHLGTHACSVGEAAKAVGLRHDNARKALAKPHVRALLLQVMDVGRMTLRAGALAVLQQSLASDDLNTKEKTELAFRILERVGVGEAALEDGKSLTPQGKSNGTGVTLNIALPHAAAREGVTVDAPRS